MTIPEQAVQAALDKWRDHELDGTLDNPRLRAALTAAAPYISSSSREHALEEAAQIAELHEGEPCHPAIAWTEDQRQFYESGQLDASSSISTAIRALKSQPAPQTGDRE